MTSRSLRSARRPNFRFGSWSCGNGETGSLTGLDCSATKLGEDFEHILPISPATQTDARPERREPPKPSQKGESRDASRPNPRHYRFDADNVQYTCQIVGEHMQRHLGGNLRQRLHQEVRGTHPHLHCTEGMLSRLTARAHGLRILVEPLLHCLDNLLVFPSRDAALSSCRTLSFECAGAARIGPITVKCLAVLLVRIVILQFFTRRPAIDIFIGQINKVLLAKAAFRFRARSLRLRQRDGDAGLIAGQDLLAVKVAAISHSFELVDNAARSLLRVPCSQDVLCRCLCSSPRAQRSDDARCRRRSARCTQRLRTHARSSPSSGCRDRSAIFADRVKPVPASRSPPACPSPGLFLPQERTRRPKKCSTRVDVGP